MKLTYALTILTVSLGSAKAAVLFSDDFSTDTLATDYTFLNTNYNSIPETVTLSRGIGNFLQVSETFNLDSGAATEMTISFNYAFGISMFGSSFSLEYNDNNGTGWQQIDEINRTGVGENNSGLASNPYTITINEGMTFSFTDGASIRFIDDNDSGGGGYHIDNLVIEADIVPEPSSTALLGLGGLMLILRRRK